MNTASIILSVSAVLAALPFAVLGTAKIASTEAMQVRAAHLGFTAEAYRRIGLLELAGAAGLLLGLAMPAVGLAAASGLLVLLVCATALHLRRDDDPKAAAPAAVALTLVLGYGVALMGAIS